MRLVGLFAACVVLLGVTICARESHAQPFVESWLGDYPVILSAPHGGYLTPDSLKDRTCSGCITGRDTRTQEWARHLGDEIFLLTGRRPYSVINLLARSKLDANRDLQEAADGDPVAAEAWTTYHEAMDRASADVTTRFGAGLVLDLHGHGHAIARFELGYLLSAATLRLSNSDLDGRSAQSSTFSLAREASPFSALIRGPNSFGELLQTQGIAATPSLSDPAPAAGEPFFSGGYITFRHGSVDGGTVDAMQLEAYFPGARDSNSNVAQLAKQVARAVVSYMEQWYTGAVSTRTGPVALRPEPEKCLAAFSNPAAIWVEVRTECGADSVTVRISDVLGRVVAQVQVNGRARFDRQRLPAGLYFATAQGKPGAVAVVVR